MEISGIGGTPNIGRMMAQKTDRIESESQEVENVENAPPPESQIEPANEEIQASAPEEAVAPSSNTIDVTA